MNEEHPEYNHFLGILKSGTAVKKNKLADIINIPSLEYILEAKYRYTFKGPSNTTHWFQYTIINKEGNPIPLKVGDFEIIYIDEDSGCTNFFGRDVQVHDIKRDTYYTYKSMCWAPRFIKEELIPLLQNLNEYGSWEEYHLANKKISTYGGSEAFNLYQEIITMRKKEEDFTREKEELEKHSKSIEAENSKLKIEQESLSKDYKNTLSKCHSLEKKFNDLNNDYNKLYQGYNKSEQMCIELRKKNKNSEENYQTLRTSYTTLNRTYLNETTELKKVRDQLIVENRQLSQLIYSKKSLLKQLFK